MKRGLVYFISIFLVCSAYGQINEQHNRIRIGDEIIKQQVEFKEPQEAGINQLWDFSKLKTINDSYSLLYSSPYLQGDSLYVMGYNTFAKKDIPEDELIIGTEHNTMYYYRLRDNILYLLGHENPTVKLLYVDPIPTMYYPINFGELEKGMTYTSKGLYSSTVKMHTEGTSSIVADAFGKMILPTGDTISPVLRIKTIKTIGDNVEVPKTKVETFQWYTKGYRYPIFETIESINIQNNERKFATAFFYPPQEHLYLETDPDNMALIEESWSLKQPAIDSVASKNEKIDEIILSHKIYPSIVDNQLNIEYTLKKQVPVQILLVSSFGSIVKNIQKKAVSSGLQSEIIQCSGLPWGSYYLKIVAGNQIISQSIIKK